MVMDLVRERPLVIMGNLLVEAHYKLSEMEQKLLRLIISKIQAQDNSLEKKYYRILIEEFREFIGHKELGRLYKEMFRLARALRTSTITIRLLNGNMIETSWIASFEYPRQRGWIEFEFSSKLEPHLLALTEQFTKYYLRDIGKLKGEHTIRVYELVRQYLNSENNARVFDVINLKVTLGVEKKYIRTSGILRDIIALAHREICAKTNISFKYRPVKESRKIVAIEFYNIHQKEPTDLEALS